MIQDVIVTKDVRVRGMTLIEVLIAIGILSIVSTLVWQGFSQTTRNKKRIENSIDHYHEMSLSLERMVRDLSMAFVSAQINPSPSLQTIQTIFVGDDRGDRDRIDFTSFSHQRLFANAHESDINELSYFLAADPDNPRKKVLARREQRRPDDHPREGGESMILMRDVIEFNLEYLDPLSHEWVREWDTMQATGQLNRLPSQVKITLAIEMDEGERNPKKLSLSTRASLPLRYAINHAMYKP
ncbi:MAG: prepilin-type N-terminal cleavage/methylation domain-containing protein [Myxococcales bacterium]|nr:MAG: prepilin-type N-terminal cleavage/methylation domain-containing protein [Myxococcales bacterium]